ncbi:MAG TPA: DHA2 family efflux MFS transporter permease subunit [Jatrophihabitantaceae bacterium]|jgi:EmrB/QacA subfamily drug resistance transporter|nr:DHA2 family efflux MFS transporter permease subunit [Jatrophihabitantaceae bacterium]
MTVSLVRPAQARATESVREPRRYLVFAVVAVALFMASVDQTIVATALSTLQRDLGAAVNWSSWTITVYALGQIMVMPLAGRVSDQFGRRRVFVASIALFTVASLCCGLANDIYVLVALRAVQAIGGGSIMPSATGIVADQFGPDRDRAIGLFTSIFPIGGIVGPILGGVFVTYWSWRWIFLVNVPIGIVVLGLAAVFIPRTERRTRGRIDLAGVAMLGVGVLAVMFAASYLGAASASALSPEFLLTLVVGIAALVVFVHHAGHAADPFIPLRLLRGSGFAVMNLINFAFGVAVLGFATLVPLYAQDRYGVDILAAGTLLTARAIGMIAVAGVSTFALRRTGYRRPMFAGFLLCAAGLLMMAIPATGVSPYLWLAVAAGVTGLGMGVSVPATNNAIMHLAPSDTGSIAGLRGMFRQGGGITGVAVVTAVIARSGDPGIAQAWSLVFLAALLLAIVPLILLVPEHRGSW